MYWFLFVLFSANIFDELGAFASQAHWLCYDTDTHTIPPLST